MVATIVTFNPNDMGAGNTLSNGNLTITNTGQTSVRATNGKTAGKWYWEAKVTSLALFGSLGVANKSFLVTSTTASQENWRGTNLTSKYPEMVLYSNVSTPTNTTVGVALDLDNGTLRFFNNGVDLGISHTDLKTLGEVFPVYKGVNSDTRTVVFNFGSTPFTYTIPTGFKAYTNYVLNNFLIQSNNNYYSLLDGVLNEFSFSPTITTFTNKGNNKSDVLNFDQKIAQKNIYSSDTAQPDSTIALNATLGDIFANQQIKIIEFTDDIDQSNSSISLETSPFTLYDELEGNTQVLCYTNDPTKTTATITITDNYNPLDDLDNPTLLAYSTTESELSSLNINTNVTSNPVLIKQTRDYSTENLSKILFNITQSGISYLKIIVSGDQGQTWKTVNAYSDGTFKIDSIDPTNLSAVKLYGSTATILSSLTSTQWSLISSSNTYRFAYYLEQFSASDVAKVDSVISTETSVTETPTLADLKVVYNSINKTYSGLLFMDTSEKYYSTALGDILQYLDFGTLIVGQTSVDIQVILTNTYPDAVKNIQIYSQHNIEGLNVEFSLSNAPFNPSPVLNIPDTLNLGDTVSFYVRLKVDGNAEVGGLFNIFAKSEFA